MWVINVFYEISGIMTDHRWRKDCFQRSIIRNLLTRLADDSSQSNNLFQVFSQVAVYVPSPLSLKFVLKQNRRSHEQKLFWRVQLFSFSFFVGVKFSINKHKYFQLRQLYRTVKQLKNCTCLFP